MTKFFQMDTNNFINRTLNFNMALNKGRGLRGSVDELQDMQQSAHSCVQWYNTLECGKQKIRDFMINLDNISRIQSDDECIKTIYMDSFIIMDSIANKIAKLKTNLSGRLVKMGSAYNHMKIDKPDEFDFTYEMSIENILNDKAKITEIKFYRGRFIIYVDFEGDHPDISEFDFLGFQIDPVLEEILSANGNKDAEFYKGVLRPHGDVYILNTTAIAYELFNVLDSVVANLELPNNWSHGGYNFPKYSGLRLKMPAYLIQFAYQHPDKQTPLVISFDFAPVLKLPQNMRCTSNDVVDEYLDRHGYINTPWQRLDSGITKGGYYSFAEEEWLKTYDSSSVPKVVIRVCKALHNMVKLTTPKYLNRNIVAVIAGYHRDKDGNKDIHEKTNTFMMEDFTSVKTRKIPSQSEFATLSDVYENVGGYDYVSSYIFKRIVMTLMVLDKCEGREWAEDDIPDLVISVFLIINDIIMSVNQATNVMTNVKETKNKISCSLVPRSELNKNTKYWNQSITREELVIPLEHLLEPEKIYKRSDKAQATHLPELKHYFTLHDAIRKGKCTGCSYLFLREQFCDEAKRVGLDEGIERVIKLLRCVSDGSSRAIISIKTPEEEDDKDYKFWITRTELHALMKESQL